MLVQGVHLPSILKHFFCRTAILAPTGFFIALPALGNGFGSVTILVAATVWSLSASIYGDDTPLPIRAVEGLLLYFAAVQSATLLQIVSGVQA